MEMIITQVLVLRRSTGSPDHRLLGSGYILIQRRARQDTAEKIVEARRIVGMRGIIHVGAEKHLSRWPQDFFCLGIVRIEKRKAVVCAGDRSNALPPGIDGRHRRNGVKTVQNVDVGAAGSILGIDVKAFQNAERRGGKVFSAEFNTVHGNTQVLRGTDPNALLFGRSEETQGPVFSVTDRGERVPPAVGDTDFTVQGTDFIPDKAGLR